MILDKYLSFKFKVILSMMAGSVWIYFRTQECYKLLPRKSILSILFVCTWIYLNYYEPLFLPIGLLTMYIYYIKTVKNKKIKESFRIKKIYSKF